MFIHQQRLLLFVAAALAVAMNMGVIMSTEAAALPSNYRQGNMISKRNEGEGKPTYLRKFWKGIPMRSRQDRELDIRPRELGRRNQKPLKAQTSSSDSGSGSGSGSGSSSGSDSSEEDDSSEDDDSSDSSNQCGSSSNTGTVTSITVTVTSTSSSSSSTSTSNSVSASTSASTTTSTPASQTTSTSTSSTSSTTNAASPVATVTTGGGTRIMLQSNSPGYGYNEAMNDLNRIMSWAGDDGNLSDAQKQEVVAALFSGSARYWPELPTKDIIRIMLADIRAESDFRPGVLGGPRLDSGASYGLLQISPDAGAQMMSLIKNHMNVNTHNFTWGIDAPNVRAGIRGQLIDWESGEKVNLASLTNDDLLRPWINIHVSMWIQSNLARTSSNDPYWWTQLNDYSWSLKQSNAQQLTATQSQTYTNMLYGAGVPRSPKTALGSWVAGAATNGNGSYLSSGDDVSATYFAAIMKSINFLYNDTTGTTWTSDWLDSFIVNAGLTDYVPSN